jgi:cyclopropane fatty-acyl-phospholipid synthase-like methyltransferase
MRCVFQIIQPDDCVLDIGCGHGAFINAVVARKRIGVDAWPDFPNYLQAGVEPIVGSAVEVGELVKEPVDFAFASNLFEHLTQTDLMTLLGGVRKILSPRGTLNIIQPNYRYAYREYFDDYTHIAIYSHVSLCDLLRVCGFDIVDVQPRFLPLSIKSGLPVNENLIRAYLASPIKPMGKQMLIRARVRSTVV